MKVYIICPVRRVTPEQKLEINSYVRWLECHGNDVYLPYRDTPREWEEGGKQLRIANRHREEIRTSNRVDIFWADGSTGSGMDLAYTYAFKKPIKLIRQFTHVDTKYGVFGLIEELIEQQTIEVNRKKK